MGGQTRTWLQSVPPATWHRAPQCLQDTQQDRDPPAELGLPGRSGQYWGFGGGVPHLLFKSHRRNSQNCLKTCCNSHRVRVQPSPDWVLVLLVLLVLSNLW